MLPLPDLVHSVSYYFLVLIVSHYTTFRERHFLFFLTLNWVCIICYEMETMNQTMAPTVPHFAHFLLAYLRK